MSDNSLTVHSHFLVVQLSPQMSRTQEGEQNALSSRPGKGADSEAPLLSHSLRTESQQAESGLPELTHGSPQAEVAGNPPTSQKRECTGTLTHPLVPRRGAMHSSLPLSFP